MKNKSAYTLIEVIIVMAVTSLLAGVGLTSLNAINRRQSLVQNVKNIVSDIRLAKSMADSQQKYGVCGALDDTLNGYRVLLNANGLVSLRVECNDSDSDIYKTKDYPVSISGVFDIYFPVLHQPVEMTPSDAGQQIVISQSGQSVTISIAKTGVINYE